MMVAIRRSALFLVWLLAGSLRQTDTSSANPSVPAAGHLSGEDLHRSRRQKPRQARPDHLTADQYEDGAAQSVEVVFLPCGGGAIAPQPLDRAVSPGDVASSVGAADQPPVLPCLPGMLLQPAQDLCDAGAAAGLRAGSVEDERRCEQPR
jgi:hypothetical protein